MIVGVIVFSHLTLLEIVVLILVKILNAPVLAQPNVVLMQNVIEKPQEVIVVVYLSLVDNSHSTVNMIVVVGVWG
jgi:hypothetical protein